MPHPAEQRRRGGNPDGQGDDSRRRETGAPAEDTERSAEIYRNEVQQEVSSATSAKGYYAVRSAWRAGHIRASARAIRARVYRCSSTG